MVLDSSAIVAIEAQEPGYEKLIAKIDRAAGPVLAGAPTALEAAMVLTACRGRDAAPWVSGFLRSVDAEVIPFSARHFEVAAKAFARFGKGRHPAGLNYGDCFSYALSKTTREPLLFKGKDFAKTDLIAAH